MCGIAGYSSQQGNSDFSPDLSEVVNALRHRGPDGSGTYHNEEHHIGLAHVRLSIIDLNETGAQPMHSEDGSKVLVYNGEIYNFRELRETLVSKGHKFRGTSDTEILLRLLEREGLAALPKLNGMFAFAICDTSTGEVTVVRDAYGVKPLYYCEDKGAILFSSEIRGLLAMGVTAQEPKPEILGRYLSYLWNPGPETPAANICALQPGEAMILKAGCVVKKWTWFASPLLAPKISNGSVNTHISETTQNLREAVHRQMVADVPVGAFLSGGLDSSAVVAFAREVSPDLTCYTIETAGGAEDGSIDDLPYARRVAEHLNVPLEVVHVEPGEITKDLEYMVQLLEEPLADPAALNVLYIARRAREQGIKVLMSGSGGDDLFTGYRRHRAVSLDKYLQYIPTSVRRGMSGIGNKLDRSRPSTRRLAKFLDGFDTDGPARLINYFLWTKRSDLVALFAPQWREIFSNKNVTQPMHDYLERVETGTDPINSMLALEQRFFLSEHNLIYTDKMSMAASIEVRVPFLDIDLANYASTLPVEVKQRGKEGKWVLKKAMEPFLPHDVIYRPKAGFGVPLRRWLQGELNEMKHDLLSHDTLSRRGFFDATAVQKLIAQDAAGQKDASYTILSLMCIEIWCRTFLDNATLGSKPLGDPRPASPTGQLNTSLNQHVT